MFPHVCPWNQNLAHVGGNYAIALFVVVLSLRRGVQQWLVCVHTVICNLSIHFEGRRHEFLGVLGFLSIDPSFFPIAY